MPSVESDLDGDISEMLIGESNELSPTNNHDESSSSLLTSFLDESNEPFNDYLHPLPSQTLSRKLLLLSKQRRDDVEEQHQRKQFNGPSISASSSLPAEFNINAAIAESGFADPSQSHKIDSLSRLSESTRLSPSLQALVEKNSFARTWLATLLQNMMQEQPVPYIFKYGRRRK
jgi:hypothetical protein